MVILLLFRSFRIMKFNDNSYVSVVHLYKCVRLDVFILYLILLKIYIFIFYRTVVLFDDNEKNLFIYFGIIETIVRYSQRLFPTVLAHTFSVRRDIAFADEWKIFIIVATRHSATFYTGVARWNYCCRNTAREKLAAEN